MFSCKTCPQKDERIADLKDQISFLRSQVQPSGDQMTLGQLEADAILSGQQHIIEIRDDGSLVQSADDENSERDRILSGNY